MFRDRVNMDSVSVVSPDSQDEKWLEETLKEFAVLTGSKLAQAILVDWSKSLRHFLKVCQSGFSFG